MLSNCAFNHVDFDVANKYNLLLVRILLTLYNIVIICLEVLIFGHQIYLNFLGLRPNSEVARCPRYNLYAVLSLTSCASHYYGPIIGPCWSERSCYYKNVLPVFPSNLTFAVVHNGPYCKSVNEHIWESTANK